MHLWYINWSFPWVIDKSIPWDMSKALPKELLEMYGLINSLQTALSSTQLMDFIHHKYSMICAITVSQKCVCHMLNVPTIPKQCDVIQINQPN